MTAHYDIFLSYNREDQVSLDTLSAELQKRGLRGFVDHQDLSYGQQWTPELESALRDSSAVAVLIGPAGLGPWQFNEMSWALVRQSRLRKQGITLPVIPVLLPGADMKEVDGFLALYTWIDLRGGLVNEHMLDRLAAQLKALPAHPGANNPTTIDVMTATICPYRGLQVFREVDGSLYFGREKFVEQLIRKVDRGGLCSVVGPSGSGKSSVVQAGLIPKLRRRKPPAKTWNAVVFKPGAQPMFNFADAIIKILNLEFDQVQRLAADAYDLVKKLQTRELVASTLITRIQAQPRAHDRLLIVIDQFEESFTMTADAERLLFFGTLIDCSRCAGATVLLTLRADFYGRALSHRELSDLIQRGIVNLGPMRRDELRLAIRKPASLVGVTIESELVERILDHLDEQPGHLPLLEFTLTELFNQRKGNNIGGTQYNEIGGVAGAVAQRAEEIFHNHPSAEQELGQRALTRLVRVADGNEEGSNTRQRVPRAALPEGSLPLIDALMNERMLVCDRDASNQEMVELAHEALLKHWPRLHDWVETDRKFLLFRQRLSRQVEERRTYPSDLSLLLASDRLEEAKRWRRDRSIELSPEEKAFIDASVQKEQRESRRWQLARRAAAILLVFMVTSIGTWVAWTRTDRYQTREILNTLVSSSASLSPDAQNHCIDALVAINRLDLALDIVEKNKYIGWKQRALVHIAQQLAERGEKAQAMEQLRRALGSPADSPLIDHNSTISSNFKAEVIAAATAIARISPSDYASLGPLTQLLRGAGRSFECSILLEEMAHTVRTGMDELSDDAMGCTRAIADPSERLQRLSEIASYWHTEHRKDLADRALQDSRQLLAGASLAQKGTDYFYAATLARLGRNDEAMGAFRASISRADQDWVERQVRSTWQLALAVSRAGLTDQLLAIVRNRESFCYLQVECLQEVALGVAAGSPGREQEFLELLKESEPYEQIGALGRLASSGGSFDNGGSSYNARWEEPIIVPQAGRQRAVARIVKLSALLKISELDEYAYYVLSKLPLVLAANDELSTSLDLIRRISLRRREFGQLLQGVALDSIKRGKVMNLVLELNRRENREQSLVARRLAWLAIADAGLAASNRELADLALREILHMIPVSEKGIIWGEFPDVIDTAIAHERLDWAWKFVRQLKLKSMECAVWTAQILKELESPAGYQLATKTLNEVDEAVCRPGVRAAMVQKLVLLGRPDEAARQFDFIKEDQPRAAQALSYYYAQHGDLRRARLLTDGISDPIIRIDTLADLLLATASSGSVSPYGAKDKGRTNNRILMPLRWRNRGAPPVPAPIYRPLGWHDN